VKIGIVDLGTNSLRFDIYKLYPHQKAVILYHKKDMLRLGEGVFTRQKLSQKAVHRVIKSLMDVKHLAQKYEVKKITCYGTSPFREAKDSNVWLKKIKEKTGFKISAISGKKEATLIAQGILHYHPTSQKTALIDIGGGSTEISICQYNKILFSKSLNLGSMRLQHVYLKKSPPSQKSIEYLRSHIQYVLKKAFKNYTVDKAIGSAGTIKALLNVASSSHHKIYRKNLESFLESIQPLTLQKLKNILKTEGQRGDIIVAGSILLLEILRHFNLHSISVTKRGLRDGILLENIQHYATFF